MSCDLPEPTRRKRHAEELPKGLKEEIFKEDEFHKHDEHREVLVAIPDRPLVDKDGNPEERVSGVLNFQENGYDDVFKHAQMVRIFQDCGNWAFVAKAKIEASDDANEIKELTRGLEWAEHQHNVARQWLEQAELYKTVRQ